MAALEAVVPVFARAVTALPDNVGMRASAPRDAVFARNAVSSGQFLCSYPPIALVPHTVIASCHHQFTSVVCLPPYLQPTAHVVLSASAHLIAKEAVACAHALVAKEMPASVVTSVIVTRTVARTAVKSLHSEVCQRPPEQ